MSYRLSRAAGGHLVHARKLGSPAALCGFEPGVGARQRCMVDRSGWRGVGAAAVVTCRACKTVIRNEATG